MSKHTTLPTVARVISDTYELPYAPAYAAAITTAQQLGITTSKSPGERLSEIDKARILETFDADFEEGSAVTRAL